MIYVAARSNLWEGRRERGGGEEGSERDGRRGRDREEGEGIKSSFKAYLFICHKQCYINTAMKLL